MTNSIEVLKEIQKEHGNLFRLYAPGKSFVVPFDPDDVRAIFQNGGKHPIKPGFGVMAFYRKRRKDLYKGNGKFKVKIS